MLTKLPLAALLMSEKAALLPEQKVSEVQNPVTLLFGCWSRADRTPVDITAVTGPGNRAIDRTDAAFKEEQHMAEQPTLRSHSTKHLTMKSGSSSDSDQTG